MGLTPLDLARHALRLQDPGRGLASVAALRDHLDMLETLHVANARQAGASWSEIAGHLGVTKQALHKKHASRVANDLTQPRPISHEREHLVVTGKARQAVAFARQEARALGQTPVGTGHLLLGLLRDERGPAARVLAGLGFSLDRARLRVAELVAASVRDRGPDEEGRAGRKRARLPVSRAARRALEQSLHEAVRLGDAHLGVEHLLLALLREPRSVAVHALSAQGLGPEAVEERLTELLGKA